MYSLNWYFYDRLRDYHFCRIDSFNPFNVTGYIYI